MSYLPPANNKPETGLRRMEAPQQSVTVRDDGWDAVQTSFDKAAKISNPIKAWLFGIGADARTSALEDAARISQAAAITADADAAAADALLRRADKVAELAFRHVIGEEVQNNRIAEERHKFELDELRRKTEILEAERRVQDAKHSLEATKKFKPKKFELGQARLEARIADSHVDVAVARAAGGGAADQPKGDPAAEIVRQLDKLIEQRLADGNDNAKLTTFLDKMRKIIEETSTPKERA